VRAEGCRRSTGRLGLALALLLLGAGCASTPPSLRSSLQARTPVGDFLIAHAEIDAEAARRVQRALENAGPRLAIWGRLTQPVSVQVLPSHKALEKAVDRSGYGWLRAWARYDEVFVQSPRTWSLLGPRQREVDELMLHELTHCLMYQLAATPTGWARKRIPLWFREGMASYTARQGDRWPSLEDLARHLEEHPGEDLLRQADALYQDESDTVYGAAHHAFAFLVRRYGEQTVRELLRAMKRGPAFEPAFEAVVGVSEHAFLDDFSRYVRLRGFRPGRLERTLGLEGAQ
jgi:hypothetical protein